MSREPGEAPQFDRLLRDLNRAHAAWATGDHKKAEAILKVVASIAWSEIEERGEHDPVPESARL